MKDGLKEGLLNKVKVTDKFWQGYQKLVIDTVIPYQEKILNDEIPGVEKSHALANFRIAAGLEEGEFYGMVFQDSDVAKWLEGVAYALEVRPDAELEERADKVIEIIEKAQRDDGYLNTFFTIKEPEHRWQNLQECHELYCAGHMMEAAAAYYEVTGKDRLLHVMERMAEHIGKRFGTEEGKEAGIPGHQEIELALIRLYHVTGEKKYLETAKYFIDTRGVGENYFLEEEKRPEYKQIFPEFAGYDPRYSQSHEPVREQKTAEGHAVRAVYMYCAMADLAYEYKDKELLDACKTLWEDMTKRQMYITGSIGASGLLERFTTDYDLPNNCNYSETCASIGLALFGRRMAQITKDASYMDVVERALYNTLLSGIAQDGKSFFYVNPLEVWPDNCIDRTSKEHVKPVRQKWFGVACCPPNIARTLASMGQYIYFIDKNTAYVNLYISNEAQIELEEGALKIQIESDLTNTGHIRMAITPDGEGEHRLALRIPDYVKTYTIKRDGKILRNARISQSYLLIKDIKEQTEIEIDFEVPAKFVRANPNVREDAGKVALVKGPLVYCLEETDNGENLPSIFVNTKQELKETFESELLGGVTTIRFTGKKLNMDTWQDGALYDTREQVFEDIELKAIPYHCWDNRKTGEMLVWMKEMF